MSSNETVIVRLEHLEYLDNLRESGVTNMYGARTYLQETWPELERRESSHILAEWMRTFGDGKSSVQDRLARCVQHLK